MKWILYCLIIVLIAAPVWVLLSGDVDIATDWRTADRSRINITPLPKKHPAALVQVYAARAYNYRGLFAVHMWLSTKAKDATRYTIYQVIGWNLRHYGTALSITHDMPDRRWFGHDPVIIDQINGAKAEQAIPKIQRAVQQYPYKEQYTIWARTEQ